MKHYFKKVLGFLALGLLFSLITVYYAGDDVNHLVIILQGFVFYSVFAFLNDIIIRWFYLKTKIPNFIKIVISIIIGISLLLVGRFLVSSFTLYQQLSNDLIFVTLLPLIVMGDIYLDLYVKKNYDKYNGTLW